MQEIDLIATTTFGLEAIAAKELRVLGFPHQSVENGRILFKAAPEAIGLTNLWLRTAERVRLCMGEFTAVTFDELFEKTKALPWSDWLPENACFPVDGKSIKSTLFSVPDCQAIVKKAVAENMAKRYGQQWFSEDGPQYRIEVALLKDRATLTIDTSGAGLHKRGYRTLISDAPLKETLAAAMLYLARWHPDIALWDPFCGSGTIPIEAAMMGRRMAPGLGRDFAFQKWPNLSSSVWRKQREEARDMVTADPPEHIVGTDADPEMLRAARRNAEAAGVAADVHFQALSLSDIQTKRRYGKLVCNPPYGERLGSDVQVKRLYKELGSVFRQFDTWSFYVLTSHEDLEKLVGRRASKKRKLYNGSIKVDYYQFYGPRPPHSTRADKNS